MGDRRKCYQLYNPSHKDDIINLFQNVQSLHFIQRDDGIAEHVVDLADELDDKMDTVKGNDQSVAGDGTIKSIAPGLSCCTCDVTFSNLLDQRQHFKLDWHRHNIKRRMFFQKPIDEAEFDDIMDGLSSISGSDSDGEDLIDTTTKLSLIEKVAFSKIETSSPQDKLVCDHFKYLTHSSKLFFENNKNEVIALHQAIVTSAHSVQADEISDADNISLPFFDIEEVVGSSTRKLGVVMLSGGHFAAAIFEGTKETRHKTFHRYTVRAKQGGSQSRSDNKSGGSGPKSAGAGLRRYNEIALTQEIQTLLKIWEEDLDHCDWVFYRVSGSSQKTLFGFKSRVFYKTNPKLRPIPFPTKRPTFSEVRKVISELTTVQVYQKEDFMRRYFPLQSSNSPKRQINSSEGKPKSPEKPKKNIDRARSRSPKTREIPSLAVVSSNEASESESEPFVLETVSMELNTRDELQELDDSLTSQERVRKFPPKKRKPRSKNLDKVKIEPWGITLEILQDINTEGESSAVARLQSRIKIEATDEDLSTLSTDLNQQLDENNSTILHVAVNKNFMDLTWLLLESGSDPALREKSGKYPYNCSPSKECRNLFRKFRGTFPEKYDYQKAQIPSPLTDEMVQEIAEKKKIQNKLKREKEKQKKMERKEKDEEVEEQKRFLNLSDREKRALAADRRLLGQCQRNGESKPILLRCFECAVDITGIVPFEYNRNTFCSPKCLAIHRKKFPVPLSI